MAFQQSWAMNVYGKAKFAICQAEIPTIEPRHRIEKITLGAGMGTQMKLLPSGGQCLKGTVNGDFKTCIRVREADHG
jgi:hypothetical protein